MLVGRQIRQELVNVIIPLSNNLLVTGGAPTAGILSVLAACLTAQLGLLRFDQVAVQTEIV